MKAITIHQPWATLIALGEKEFETRKWRTNYRGPLAIHAGKKVDRDACAAYPYREVLAKHGYTADTLPTGAIVATCSLTDCLGIGKLIGGLRAMAGAGVEWISSGSNEYHFGHYEQGRYAFKIANVTPLTEPFPAKGQQRFWNWEAPQDA